MLRWGKSFVEHFVSVLNVAVKGWCVSSHAQEKYISPSVFEPENVPLLQQVNMKGCISQRAVFPVSRPVHSLLIL